LPYGYFYLNMLQTLATCIHACLIAYKHTYRLPLPSHTICNLLKAYIVLAKVLAITYCESKYYNKFYIYLYIQVYIANFDIDISICLLYFKIFEHFIFTNKFIYLCLYILFHIQRFGSFFIHIYNSLGMG
jgi:hypothetical protein